MIVKDQEGFEVEIKGEPWDISIELKYFPATQILIHWKGEDSWRMVWDRYDKVPFFSDEKFEDACDVYNLQSRKQAFDAVKLIAEKRFSDGKHAFSFELRKLMQY